MHWSPWFFVDIPSASNYRVFLCDILTVLKFCTFSTQETESVMANKCRRQLAKCCFKEKTRLGEKVYMVHISRILILYSVALLCWSQSIILIQRTDHSSVWKSHVHSASENLFFFLWYLVSIKNGIMKKYKTSSYIQLYVLPLPGLV